MKKSLCALYLLLLALIILFSSYQVALSNSILALSFNFQIYDKDLNISSESSDDDGYYLYVLGSGQIELKPTDDAYTDSYLHLHNYGDTPWSGIQVDGNSFRLKIGWLKFDVSGIPRNASGISAILRLSCNPQYYEPEFVQNAPVVTAYYCSDDSWNEETITWSNQPSYSSTALDSKRIYRGAGEHQITGELFNWNVTDAVIQSLSRNDSQVTIVMKCDRAALALQFDSKESAFGGAHPRLIVRWDGISFEFRVSIDGIFRCNVDDKWRCYANLTITNSNKENLTLAWIYVNALNLTYNDGTSEVLGIAGNHTVNEILQYGGRYADYWNITAFGFDKQPKLLWAQFDVCFSEFDSHLDFSAVIPEYPSIIFQILFLTLIAGAITIYRKKRSKDSSSIRSSQLFP